MRKLIFLFVLIFPNLAFGQSYEGNYRAIFFNLFSEPRTIITEFEVKQDNSLSGKIKIDTMVKDFKGTVDKKGKFEAVIEQVGSFTYKLKGKFDRNNKISLVQRSQVGSGLNKSVSENSLEGNFAKVAKPVEKVENNVPQTKIELIDNGKNWLKLDLSNPMFGTEWADFKAFVGFGISTKTPLGTETQKTAESDYFIISVKSQIEGQQELRINLQNYKSEQKLWKQNEIQVNSYREVNGENRNSFLSGATMKTDPRYAEGTLEIVKETDTQIVFKLTNFKIKRLTKDDFVTLNGFIYADKFKK